MKRPEKLPQKRPSSATVYIKGNSASAKYKYFWFLFDAFSVEAVSNDELTLFLFDCEPKTSETDRWSYVRRSFIQRHQQMVYHDQHGVTVRTPGSTPLTNIHSRQPEIVRSRGLSQNLDLFKDSFRILCIIFFLRGNHLYFFRTSQFLVFYSWNYWYS